MANTDNLFAEEEVPTFDELMDDLSDEQVEILSSYMEKIQFVPGETIFYEDEPAESIYIVQNGSVEISKLSEDKDEYIPFVSLKPGNIFGEMSFLVGGRTSATAVAKEHSILYRIDRNSFQDIIEEHPLLGCQIYQAISQILVYRLQRSDEKLTELVKEKEAKADTADTSVN